MFIFFDLQMFLLFAECYNFVQREETDGSYNSGTFPKWKVIICEATTALRLGLSDLHGLHELDTTIIARFPSSVLMQT